MEIGDFLIVIKNGCTYTSYRNMAEYMRLTKWVNDCNGRGYNHEKYLPKENKTYRIVAKARHGDENKDYDGGSRIMLYGIEDMDTGKQYIINENGVVYCPFAMFDLKDFEI